MRTIVHVDMDAFYASVEQRDNPRLRGRPVVVGQRHRGVVAAASYEARTFGIRSAMPTRRALALCPELIVVPPRFDAYRTASQAVFAIFARYTPQIEGLSLDEAFLDVTQSLALFGDGGTIASAIRRAIHTEQHLAASAGVAPNKFMAKLASEMAKPDGLRIVAQEQVDSVLSNLRVEQLWGVGDVAAKKFHRAGLYTLTDIRAYRPEGLIEHFGALGAHVLALAHGHDEREVTVDAPAKSVGAEATFDEDIADVAEIEQALLAHALRVSGRLMALSAFALGVQVKLKTHDFVTHTRQAALEHGAFDPDTLFRCAKELLARFDLHGRRFRLCGLSAQPVAHGTPPAQLFVDPQKGRREAVERTRHAIAAKFGGNALTRASLVAKKVPKQNDLDG